MMLSQQHQRRCALWSSKAKRRLWILKPTFLSYFNSLAIEHGLLQDYKMAAEINKDR